MSKRNRTPVDVDFVEIESELLDTINVLRRKCLVDLQNMRVNIGTRRSLRRVWYTSNKSTSALSRPVFLSTIGIAYTGPIPITRGGTPTKRASSQINNITLIGAQVVTYPPQLY